MMSSLDIGDCLRVITAALAEDLGEAGENGDLTSISVVAPDLRFQGIIQTRHEIVVAGLPVAELAFRSLTPDLHFAPRSADGELVAAGTPLAHIEGPALPLLAAERTALNLLQFLSGIATLTRRYVDQLAGTRCTLLDTRKTIPGMRMLSKYAASCGGARNHRLGLHDAILIKDNHIAVCGSVSAAIRRVKQSAAGPIEVECDTLAQVDEALAEGVDRLLLDNMAPEMLREAVTRIAGRAETEASGGINLGTLRAIAESGVDYVSVGRITQSAPAVDIGLDWSSLGTGL